MDIYRTVTTSWRNGIPYDPKNTLFYRSYAKHNPENLFINAHMDLKTNEKRFRALKERFHKVKTTNGDWIILKFTLLKDILEQLPLEVKVLVYADIDDVYCQGSVMEFASKATSGGMLIGVDRDLSFPPEKTHRGRWRGAGFKDIDINNGAINSGCYAVDVSLLKDFVAWAEEVMLEGHPCVNDTTGCADQSMFHYYYLHVDQGKKIKLDNESKFVLNTRGRSIEEWKFKSGDRIMEIKTSNVPVFVHEAVRRTKYCPHFVKKLLNFDFN